MQKAEALIYDDAFIYAKRGKSVTGGFSECENTENLGVFYL